MVFSAFSQTLTDQFPEVEFAPNTRDLEVAKESARKFAATRSLDHPSGMAFAKVTAEEEGKAWSSFSTQLVWTVKAVNGEVFSEGRWG